MKINKDLIVTYEEICIGACFKCKNDGIYMKTVSAVGDIFDVNLENGLIAPPLDNNTKVTYLPIVTINTIGEE